MTLRLLDASPPGHTEMVYVAACLPNEEKPMNLE